MGVDKGADTVSYRHLYGVEAVQSEYLGKVVAGCGGQEHTKSSGLIAT